MAKASFAPDNGDLAGYARAATLCFLFVLCFLVVFLILSFEWPEFSIPLCAHNL